jgi:hypothetical protein
MTPKEKSLYHQIHPAKLATDIAASVISLYFFWQHQLVPALAIHFVPPLVASLLLVRFGALEPLRDSAFGRYVKRNMTRVIEMVRLFGDVVTMFGAWYHDWMLIAAGFAVILGAWANGLLPSGLARR